MLEKTLRAIAIAGVFAVPFVCLFVAESLFFPFITGKNFAFRIIVEIMTGAWLALALISPEYRPRRSLILGSLGLFTLIILIADLQGAYPFKSIWSNFERMDGWVTIAHLFAYTVVAASVMRTQKLWQWAMWTTLAVSAYLSFYGLLQIAGFQALGQGGASGLTARIDATFGNPIYFAVYMLFHVFIAAMLWTHAWVSRGPGKRLGPSLLFGAIIVADTFMLLATGTRGTILGLICGALLAMLLVLVLASKSKVAWRVSVGGVVAVLVIMGAVWLVRDAAFVQKVVFLNRMTTITLSENTVKARFLNWGMAWEGVKERPLLGWGQENYAIVFDKYYDPRMHGQEPWFDRVHNIVFDWWVAGGTLGLLAYFSIFAATLWALWRSGAFTIAERAILTGLLAGYFVHNFFVFDNVTSYILFGTILAYIAWRDGEHRKLGPVIDRWYLSHTHMPYIVIAAALLVWGLAWGVNAKGIATNRALLQGLATQGDLQKSYDQFKKALSYGSLGTQEVREQLAQGAAQIAQANVPTAMKQQFYDLGTNEMKLQEAESPLDARFPLFLGVLYGAFGDLENARVALDRAQSLSPKKQSIFFERAQNAELRGKTEESIALYKEASELVPSMRDPRIVYAAVLIRNSRMNEADAVLEPLIESGSAADQRILAGLVTRRDYDRIVRIWTAYTRVNPADVQGFFTLAAAHFEGGDRASAVETLQEAAQAHPDVRAQVLDLIRQIESGQLQTGQ